MTPFYLKIITPEAVFFQGEVLSLVAPGSTGSFGVLANHAPLVSTLAAGVFTLTSPDSAKKSYQIGVGFLDVLKNNVTLLTTSIS
jgi:F-type H+-transporting ATPase subunit epsilon